MFTPAAMSLRIWILLVTFKQFVLSAEKVVPSREYCQWETFNATCGRNEVVVMETARYGRIRVGRCVRQAYNIGCAADVVPFADSKCSGLSRCKITVADISIQGIRPCPLDFTSYFEAAYTCVKVLGTNEANQCHLASDRIIRLKESSGYISSLGGARNAVVAGGSEHCKWHIQAKPGQQINLTLHDFTTYRKDSEAAPRSRSSVCRRVALVKDLDFPNREFNVCVGRGRLEHVTLSKGHRLQIQLFTTATGSKPSDIRFLLHYKSLGCALPLLPPGVAIQRTKDSLHIYCNATSTRWRLTCVDSIWVGKFGNCSAIPAGVRPENMWGVLTNDWTSPYGLTIVIGLGVLLGVIIGVCLLGTVIIIIRRRQRNVREEVHPDYFDSTMDPYLRDDGRIPSYCRNSYNKEGEFPVEMLRAQQQAGVTPSGLIVEFDGHTTGYQTMSVDTGTVRQEQPPRCAVPHSIAPNGSHIYESPKFQKREAMPNLKPPNCPKK